MGEPDYQPPAEVILATVRAVLTSSYIEELRREENGREEKRNEEKRREEKVAED